MLTCVVTYLYLSLFTFMIICAIMADNFCEKKIYLRSILHSKKLNVFGKLFVILILFTLFPIPYIIMLLYLLCTIGTKNEVK